MIKDTHLTPSCHHRLFCLCKMLTCSTPLHAPLSAFVPDTPTLPKPADVILERSLKVINSEEDVCEA